MAAVANETEPLLRPELDNPRLQSGNFGSENVVDFDPSGDDENPQDWPAAYKWGMVTLLAVLAFTVTFTCISLVPMANTIIEDLNHGQLDKRSSVMLVTIWELGEAAGPFFVAPLSETIGRYPVMIIANVFFIGATLLASFSPTAAWMVSLRFITGMAVAGNVLNPAIVGDMFAREQRGKAMSFIMFAPLLGGAIGPAISGAIAQSIGWRPVLWICAALAGTCEIVFLACFRETFKVPILNRKAARLRKETGNPKLQSIIEMQKSGNGDSTWESVLRPIVVFAGSGVLQVTSLASAVTFSLFYTMSTTFPDILQGIYGLNPAETGLAFMSFSIGSVLAVFLSNRYLDQIYISMRDRHKGVEQAEFRLPFSIVGFLCIPPVVALYGWIPQARLPLWSELLTVAFLGFALCMSSVPLLAYVVDAFGLYSASALTTVIVTRCLTGTFLPLVMAPLVVRLDYGLAFTVLTGICLLVAPIPVLLMRYGQTWRSKGRYTKDA